MDFDFSAILLVITGALGTVWLVDHLFLRAKRKAQFEASGSEYRDPVAVDWARSLLPVVLTVLLVRSFVAEPFRIPSGSMMPTLDVGDFILVNKFAYGLRLPAFNNKFLGIGEPKRGDVVVFRFPGYLCRDSSGKVVRAGGDESGEPTLGPSDACPTPRLPVQRQNWIKRVIGLPGDTIEVHDSRIVINGKPVASEQLGAYVGNSKRQEDAHLLQYGASIWSERLPGKDVRVIDHLVLRMPALTAMTRSIPNALVPSVVPAGCYLVMGDDRENSLDGRWWGCMPEKNLVGKAFLIWFSWRGWDSGGIAWRRIGTLIH